MADNMIELVARLDTGTSAGEINKTDIPDLQKQINKLQIKCNLDTGSINALKNQFSKLSTSFGSTGIKKVTDDIVKKFNDSFNMVGKVSEESKKQFNAQTKQMLQELKTTWEQGLTTGDTKPYYDALDKLGQRISDFSRGDVKLLKEAIADIRREFTDGSVVSIGSNLKRELDYLTGSDALTRQKLDALYGSGKYTIGTGNAGYDTLFQRDEEATNAILNAANKILSYQNKIKSVGWGLDELQEVGLSAQDITDNIEDALRKIVGLPELPKTNELVEIDVSDDIQEVNQLGMAIERLGESESNAGEQTEEWRKKQERVQQDYEILAATIKKAKLNIDEIATRDGVNYNQIFNNLMSGDITNATKLNEAKDAIAAIRKEFRLVNAEMASDIPQNAIEGLVSRIAKADSQIKVLKIDFDKLSQVPDYLQESFGKLQETMKGFDFSSDYQINSKEELSQRVQQYTQIKVALNDTQALLKVAQKEEQSLNAETAKRNKEIERQIKLRQQEINKARELNEAEMHNYWQGRFEESVKGMTAENQILKDMKKYYEDLNNEAIKAEKQQAQDENRIANLQNRISRLAAEVNRYGEANERATKSMQQMSNGKTFAVEWSRITTKMAKGADLTDRELKDLSADMAVFRKEAQAAGLAGESAFGKFINSFKVMSSYITANMVFNFVKRQVRELVNEVTEVDTAMTELRKVTEATDEEFEAFAVSAGKTGRELGASVSDVINATAEFARLGESLPDAKELGRVATLYKNVGDGISADTAAEDIISTMKAFKIEAKDAITIVDKFNEVGKLCCPRETISVKVQRWIRPR